MIIVYSPEASIAILFYILLGDVWGQIQGKLDFGLDLQSDQSSNSLYGKCFNFAFST